MKPKTTVSIVLSFAVLAGPASSAQVAPPAHMQQPTVIQQEKNGQEKSGGGCREIFERVQRGLSTGNVPTFTADLAPQVLVNLRGGESGYYSASQAHYLLENYLRLRKFGRFSFTTVNESGENPYATGSAVFNYRGSREYTQVYVSLSASGSRWVITQFNIY